MGTSESALSRLLFQCHFTCFKMDSYAQENLILLKITDGEIHLQSCPFLRCLCPSVPVIHTPLLPTPGPHLRGGDLSLSVSLLLPLSLCLLPESFLSVASAVSPHSSEGKDRQSLFPLEGSPVSLFIKVAEWPLWLCLTAFQG